MGRLRRFATAGEVTEPVKATGDERAIDFESSVEAPVAPLPRAPTLAEIMARPEFLTTQKAVGVPVETINASDVEQAPIVVPAAPTMTTAAMPRMVATTEAQRVGPLAPVAPVMQRTAAPDEEEQLTDLQYANKVIQEEMAKDKPDYNLVEEYMKTFKELVDAEAAKSQPPTPIPAAPVVAASVPAAAPAPATPAAPVATVPAVATTVAPVAVAAPIAKPVAAAPVVAPAAAPVVAPTSLVPTAAVKPAELTPEQLFSKRLVDVGLDRAAYDKMTPLQKMAAQGLVRQAAALEAQTVADEEMVKGEINAQQQVIDEEKKRLNTLETRANESRDLQKKILDEMDHLKNPQSYFASMSTLGQIGSALSLAAGAFASGMTGMPNYAMQIFNNAVEKDLELQKMQRDSLFARLRNAGHSVESAEEVVRASARLVASAQAGRLAAMTKLPKVKASLTLEQAKLTNDAIMKMAQVAEIEARPEERKAERDIRRQQMAESGARAAAAAEEKRLAREQREALAEQKRLDAQAERMVNVGDEDLELRTKTGGTGIRKELSGRVAALQAAIKLEELFKEGGYEIFNPTSTKYRAEAIAELPMLIEQYPGGKGFQRAISLNAGKFLKEAMNEPLGATALVKKIFLNRDPSAGVKALRDDFQRGYVDAVRNYVREPASKRTTEAINREIQRAREVVKADEGGSEGFVFSPLSAPAAPPATPVGVPPGGMPTGMR